MKKKFFVFTLLFCVAVCPKLAAQNNLVMNPSFENVNGCPAGQNLFYVDSAYFWYNPSQSSPDLFLSCTLNGEFNHAPNSAWGFQFPNNGFNYAGFAAQFYPANADSREYLGGTLSDTLIAGKKYAVEMYLSLAFIYSCFYKSVGVYFSNTQVEVSTIEEIQVTPQITFDTIIRDTINWIKVSDTLIALGSEKYFVIGLFTNNQNTTIDTIYYDTLNPSLLAYYFVDDVSVTLIEDPPSPPPPSYPEINIFPNPSTDGIFTLQYEFDTDGVLEIYNTLGQIIFKRNLPPGAVQEIIDLSDRASGAYYYRVIKNEQQIKTGKLVISE